ncbi:MAG: hypothetical protein WC825_04615, partial [Gallionellaceae bacterium]
MRYVTDIPPVATTSPNTRHVMGLTAALAVKPVYPGEHPVASVEHLKAHPDKEHQEITHPVEQQQSKAPAEVVPTVDRRKACRRLAHQHVLIELRSGIDRRHHTLLEGDV